MVCLLQNEIFGRKSEARALVNPNKLQLFTHPAEPEPVEAIQLIPKSIATEGLLAHIAVSKFADGLPLYRQQKIFGRLDVDLSRATMANWMIQAAGCCQPIIELLHREIRSAMAANDGWISIHPCQ
jgi:hypothetical protein